MATVTVKLTANVKYNTDRYTKGEMIKIQINDLESFQRAGVIDDAYTQYKVDEYKSLSKMTIPELKEFAADKGIELDGATKRDDILAVIESHVGEQDGDE